MIIALLLICFATRINKVWTVQSTIQKLTWKWSKQNRRVTLWQSKQIIEKENPLMLHQMEFPVTRPTPWYLQYHTSQCYTTIISSLSCFIITQHTQTNIWYIISSISSPSFLNCWFTLSLCFLCQVDSASTRHDNYRDIQLHESMRFVQTASRSHILIMSNTAISQQQ